MMRQRLKTIGAPLAQIGLRRQRKNPTHGVVAGARNNTPPCVGAPMAHSVSRASRLTRYAPAALRLRRRSLAHRWPPAERHFTRDQYPQPHTVEVVHAGMHARVRGAWKALVVPSLDRYSLPADPGQSPCPRFCDQQSASLLAVSHITIVFTRLFAGYGLIIQAWECHGKIRARPFPSAIEYPTVGEAAQPAKFIGLVPKKTRQGCRWGRSRAPADISTADLPTRRRSPLPFVSAVGCVAGVLCAPHRLSEQQGEFAMKQRERLTFEMEPAIKTTLESWARAEDRSVGSLLRRIVEKAAQERRAAAGEEAR
jgi:hypothetical protein